MILGAVAAIGQKNIKRLMAYSSIGHIGYAIAGIASGTENGFKSTLIYIAIYVIMNIGAFACILLMKRGGKYIEQIDDTRFKIRRPLQASSVRNWGEPVNQSPVTLPISIISYSSSHPNIQASRLLASKPPGLDDSRPAGLRAPGLESTDSIRPTAGPLRL